MLRGDPLCRFSLLLLHARAHDHFVPLWCVMHRGARATPWIACRSVGPGGGGGAEPLCFWATSPQAQPFPGVEPRLRLLASAYACP